MIVRMTVRNWIAVNHVGKFSRGHIYTAAQLGVTGRMAVKAGLLVPYVDPLPSGRKKMTAAQRRKKGASGGESAVQAGSGPDLRDDSGA